MKISKIYEELSRKAHEIIDSDECIASESKKNEFKVIIQQIHDHFIEVNQKEIEDSDEINWSLESKKIFDILTNPVIILSNNEIVYGNKQALEYFSLSQHNLLSADIKNFIEINSPDEFDKIFEANEMSKEKIKYISADKEKKVGLTSINPIDYQGTASKLIIIDDITDKESKEDELLETQHRFVDFADMLPQTIFEADSEGNIIYGNAAAFKMFRRKEEEFSKGLHLLQMIAPEYREKATKNVKSILQGKVKRIANEYIALRGDGTHFPCHITSTTVYKNNQPVGLRGIVFDLSELESAKNKIEASELLHRTTINSISDIIYVVDIEKRIIMFNRAFASWCKILGYDERQIYNKTPFELIPFLPKEFAKSFDRVIQSTQPLLRETKVFYAGEPVFTENRLIPIIENDNVTRVIAIIRDITDRKVAEETLIQSEEKFRLIAENVQDMIMRLTKDATCIYVSPSCQKVTGYDQEEIIGLNMYEFVLPDDHAFVQDMHREFLKNDSKGASFTIQTKHKEGHKLWLEIKINPMVRENNDDEREFLAVVRNVTDNIEQQKVLSRHNSFNKSLSRLRGISEDKSEEALINELLICFIKEFEYSMCWYGNYKEDSLVPIYKQGEYEDYLDEIVNQLNQKCLKEEQCPLITALDEKKPFVVNDIFEFCDSEHILEKAEAKRFKSLAALPVIVSDSLEAGIMIYSSEKDGFSKDRIENLIKLVNELALILHERREKQKILHALQESDEKFKQLMENISITYWLFELGDEKEEDKLIYLSPKYKELSDGYIEDDVKNPYRLMDFIHPDDIHNVADQIKSDKYRKEGKLKATFRIELPNGKVKWLFSETYPVIKDGKMKRIAGFTEDITELKELEIDLRKSKKEAENSLETKNIFLTNISHEMRTPLNPIIGFSNLLMTEYDLPDEVIENIEHIHQSAERLLKIINDLLDMSKLESGTIEIKKNKVNLRKIIDECVHTFNVMAEEKALTINVNFDKRIPNKMVGDGKWIIQILNNLLSNAIKFSDKLNSTIEINAQILENYYLSRENNIFVKLSVKDMGIGISTQKLRTVFDIFTQGDPSLTRKYGGTGLGLAIVKRMVDILGGDIKIESKKGEWTEVSAILPFNKTEIEKLEGAEMSQENMKSNEDNYINVLIAEDEKTNKLLLKNMLLASKGYKTVFAENGKEAINKFVEGGIDVVLMDIKMPEVDGVEATKRIREYEKENSLEPVPIIGVTAQALIGSREKYMDVGMNEVIFKPFVTKDVYEAIEKLLK